MCPAGKLSTTNRAAEFTVATFPTKELSGETVTLGDGAKAGLASGTTAGGGAETVLVSDGVTTGGGAGAGGVSPGTDENALAGGAALTGAPLIAGAGLLGFLW